MLWVDKTMARAIYTRQSSFINIKDYRDNRISIIGCGAIGSFVGISLAKMGLTKFTLIDFDTVEAHNLPNQFFGVNDIGLPKVEQVMKYMGNFNNESVITTFKSKFNPGFDYKSEIIVCCVDTMKARKQVFDYCKKSKDVQLFIDTRMAITQGQIYTVDMENKEQIKNYQESLFSDNDAVQDRCTERSIIYTCLGIASLVCNQIVKAFKNEEKLRNFIVIDYSVPQII